MRIANRIRTLAGSALLAGGLLFLAGQGAFGLSTIKLTSQITDQTGVLDSGRSQVQAALDNLQSSHNVQLWLLFVSTTGSDTAQTVAQSEYQSNGLGGNDFLLVVALNDHRYAWWETTATGLPSSEIDGLLSSAMEPPFRAGDYPGGIIALANGLGQSIAKNNGSTGGQPTPTLQPAANGTSSGLDSAVATILWTLLALVLVGIGLVMLGLWFRGWRRTRLSAEERDKQTGDLARQANKALVDTDDAVTNAQQELGFAQAEFEDADVKPYADAIAAAQDQLKVAFSIRQKLDDSVPEDQPTKQKMYSDIISACTVANAGMDEQAKRIQALRDLEKSAPQALAALPASIQALKGRLPEIQAAMQTLSRYAPSAWASINGNAEEADKRGHFAEGQVAAGNAALAASPADANAAAHAARAAQEAVAQANQLLDAVVQMAAMLEDARTKLDKEIADAEADLVAAKAAAAASTGAGVGTGAGVAAAAAAPAATNAADLAKAEALLQTAKTQAATPAPDTIAAFKAAHDAHTALDAVLANIREASSQQARAAAAFTAARATAAAAFNQAQGFISTRHDGVGMQARTRLAEAARHLAAADALQPTDVAAATNEANIATNMATAAFNLASGDFVDFESGRYPRGGGPWGGNVGGGWSGGGGGGGSNMGASIGGAIIGGIIGSMLSGGRGGGFGGTHWGSGGGWTGGGGGFGGFGGGHGGGGSFGGGGGGGHGGGGGW